MKSVHSTLLFALIAGVLIAGSGPSITALSGGAGTAVAAGKTGPPPHAPAHGYRYKHHNGVVFVFDFGLGLYKVSGHKSVYYHERHYYRLRNGTWHIGDKIDGKFKVIKVSKLPPGFHKKWKNKNKNPVKAKAVAKKVKKDKQKAKKKANKKEK